VTTGERVEKGLSLRLDIGPNAAPKARRSLAALRGALDAQVMDTLRLLVTELVTNSVRHARAGTVLLRVRVVDSAIWTEVTDAGAGFDPGELGPASSGHTGWGLFLVERLAERWGVNRDGEGTTVWFELRRT
jgi:anti-sigma regulatory factor (Ser/Thr protein kinase)